MKKKVAVIVMAVLGILSLCTARADAQYRRMELRGSQPWRGNSSVHYQRDVLRQKEGRRDDGKLVIRQRRGFAGHRRSDRGHDFKRGHRIYSRSVIFYGYPNYYPYTVYSYPEKSLYASALTFGDIVSMSSQGFTDEAIINRIIDTRTIFQLSSSDVTYLKNNGVRSRIIDFMLDTAKAGYSYR